MKRFVIKLTSMILTIILFILKMLLRRIPVVGDYSDKVIEYLKERIDNTSKAVLALAVGVFVLLPLILAIGGVGSAKIYQSHFSRIFYNARKCVSPHFSVNIHRLKSQFCGIEHHP